MTEPLKIDANLTGLAFAEETTLKTLPGVSEADAVWFELEPNSYNDFGGELSMVARSPINASRQKKKGTVTDLDASGGFNMDLTKTNLTRLMQGFMFADAHEKANTKPLNGTAHAITAVATSDDSFSAASGLDAFKAGDLVLAVGFTNAANNGLKTVVTAAAGKITVAENLVDEAAPPAGAYVVCVGFKFGAGDLTLTASASSIVLGCTAGDFTTLGLIPGEWLFIGGDAAGLKFANANNVPGFVRVKTIAAKSLALDAATFTATTDDGAAKTVQIFFGSALRNEKTVSLIKRRSYNLERQLGNDGTGVQAEYLTGAIPNEFTLNVPQADKATIDLSFVALDHVQRNGTEGVKDGDRIAALGEDPYNTSSDLYRLRMNIVDPTALLNSPLFAYVSEMKLSIKNNVSPTKAVGVLGAFDASVGDFEVTGSITAYFATVAAVQAVRNNSDVAINAILTKDNGGAVFDVPLVALGGGRLGVEKDQSITVPLESSGAENPLGYTLMACFFEYLPSAAMPSA